MGNKRLCKKSRVIRLVLAISSLVLLTACQVVDENELTDVKRDKGADLVVKSHMYKNVNESVNLNGTGGLTEILKRMDEEKVTGVWNVDGDKIQPTTERDSAANTQSLPIGEGTLEGVAPGYTTGNYPKVDILAKQLLDKLPQMHQIVPDDTRVTSGWGWRKKHPVLGTRRAHDGIDFGIGVGTPVKAAWSGKVTFAATSRGYGKLLKIDHGEGVETRYAHLNKFEVEVGESVTAGQLVAQSGKTGLGTGPHLHFEIRYGGNSRNPYEFFKDKNVKNLETHKYNIDGR